MKPWTTRAILLSVLTTWLLSGAGAWSLLEDSEELGDDDYQDNKRELDLSNTLEDSEEQEGALENKRALEAEDSGDSDAELDSDGLKGERELGESFEKHVWVVWGYNVKPSRGTHCELQLITITTISTTVMGTTALAGMDQNNSFSAQDADNVFNWFQTGVPTTAGDASTTEKQQRPGITVLEFI
ncbi:UNVERIFIED_CONTAM: hypothetical protein FKN15_006335 [Acipenser sinensis]